MVDISRRLDLESYSKIITIISVRMDVFTIELIQLSDIGVLKVQKQGTLWSMDMIMSMKKKKIVKVPSFFFYSYITVLVHRSSKLSSLLF